MDFLRRVDISTSRST